MPCQDALVKERIMWNKLEKTYILCCVVGHGEWSNNL